MDQAEAAGRLLAERHRETAASQFEDASWIDDSLINYAESSRAGDWTLRSALVRLAQPEPLRASALVELIRRVDAALHPFARALQRQVVMADRAMAITRLEPGGSTWTLAPPIEPYPDARTVDLARMLAGIPDGVDAVVDAYSAVDSLDADERHALPLLVVALQLDALADTLANWANAGFLDPPLDEADRIGREVFARLEDLGVPRESGPPDRRRAGA